MLLGRVNQERAKKDLEWTHHQLLLLLLSCCLLVLIIGSYNWMGPHLLSHGRIDLTILGLLHKYCRLVAIVVTIMMAAVLGMSTSLALMLLLLLLLMTMTVVKDGSVDMKSLQVVVLLLKLPLLKQLLVLLSLVDQGEVFFTFFVSETDVEDWIALWDIAIETLAV